jgi:hypothetical protein
MSILVGFAVLIICLMGASIALCLWPLIVIVIVALLLSNPAAWPALVLISIAAAIIGVFGKLWSEPLPPAIKRVERQPRNAIERFLLSWTKEPTRDH